MDYEYKVTYVPEEKEQKKDSEKSDEPEYSYSSSEKVDDEPTVKQEEPKKESFLKKTGKKFVAVSKKVGTRIVKGARSTATSGAKAIDRKVKEYQAEQKMPQKAKKRPKMNNFMSGGFGSAKNNNNLFGSGNPFGGSNAMMGGGNPFQRPRSQKGSGGNLRFSNPFGGPMLGMPQGRRIKRKNKRRR